MLDLEFRLFGGRDRGSGVSRTGKPVNPHFLQAESLHSVEPSGPEPSGVGLGQVTQESWGELLTPVGHLGRPDPDPPLNPHWRVTIHRILYSHSEASLEVYTQHDGKCFDGVSLNS